MSALAITAAIQDAPDAAHTWLSRFEEQDERDNADNPADRTPQWMTTEALLMDPREADRLNDAIAYLEALSTMTAAEIARQQARQRAIDEATYQLKRAAITAMESAEITAIHGQHCTLKLRANPPALKVDDESLIPEEFYRTPDPPKPAPHRPTIKAALECGMAVPGCRLTRGTRLERK
jgi:hypothetical protein